MSARLTDVERSERRVSGSSLQAQITGLAELLGWQWVHWRPLLNRRGFYQVPVEGPLGKGWPDLTLVRPRDHRLLFAELKRETNDPLTTDQAGVLGVLRMTAAEVYVWRPSDLRDPIESSPIYEVLR